MTKPNKNFVDVVFSYQDEYYEITAVGNTFLVAEYLVNGLSSVFNFDIGGGDETEVRMTRDNWDSMISFIWSLTVVPTREETLNA